MSDRNDDNDRPRSHGGNPLADAAAPLLVFFVLIIGSCIVGAIGAALGWW